MNFTKLNTSYDAEPNAPDPEVTVHGSEVSVYFYLNPFIWDDVEEEDKAVLVFHDVYKYAVTSLNDEGWYLGQCRFSQELPWGNFYLLDGSNWQSDFPDGEQVIDTALANELELQHYLFYFRDETFECVANSYEFTRI